MVLVTIFGSPRDTEGLPTLTPVFLVVNPEVYIPYTTDTSGSVGIRSEIGKEPVPLPEATYATRRSLGVNRKTFSVSAGGVWVSSISLAPEWIFPAFKAAYTEPTQIKGVDSVTYDSTITKNLNSDWIFKNGAKVLITSQEQGVVKLITQGTFRTVIGGATEPSIPETHDMRYLDEDPVDSPTYKPKASISDVDISDVLRVVQSRGNIFNPSKKSGYQDGFGNLTEHGKTYTESGEVTEAVGLNKFGVEGLAGDGPTLVGPDRYKGEGGGSSDSRVPPVPYPTYFGANSDGNTFQASTPYGGTGVYGPPKQPIDIPPVPPVTGTLPTPTTIPIPLPPVTGPAPPPYRPPPEIKPVTGPGDGGYGGHPPDPEKYIATLNLSDVLAFAGEGGGLIRKNNEGNVGGKEHVYVNHNAVANEGAEGESHGGTRVTAPHDGGTWFTGHEQDYVNIENIFVNNGGDRCDGRGGCTHQIIHTDDLVEIHFD